MTHSDDLTGKVIASQFRIEKLLGEGGMGAVYLANQIEMNRQVVVKVAHPGLIRQPLFEERFKREAQVIAQLNHPNIVQVYIFGRTEDGQLYLAMEFIPGQTLTKVLEQAGPMPEARALRIVDQVCSALVEAHSLGLVHRDLKPDNIMLTVRHGSDDYVKVLDFGIAKILGDTEQKLTQTGAIFGTPQYMAPEQAKGQRVDQRTDIYSLGLILYELVTGVSPFSAGSTMEYLVSHINEAPEPPTRKIAGLNLLQRTEALVMKCLAKPPEARFQSVAELQRELRLCLRDRPAAARAFPTPDAPRPPARPVPPKPEAHAGGMAVPVAKFPAWAKLAFGGVAVLALALILGLTLFRRGEVKDLATVLPRDSSGALKGDLLFGIPVPKGSALVQRLDQMLFFRAPCPPEQVLDFYQTYLTRAWGPSKEVMNGLQFLDKDAPYSFLTVTRQGEFSQVYLTPNTLGKPAIHNEERTVLGVLIPAEAKGIMESRASGAVTINFHLPITVAQAKEKYRAVYTQDPKRIIVNEMELQGRPVFSAVAKGDDLAFRSFNIQPSTDELRPGPGTWSMITVSK